MRKIKLLLAVMLSAMAWTGTTAQTVVTDVSQLSNSKVYTIECPRGTFVLNNDQNAIVSSHKTNKSAANDAAATDDASMQFGIINVDGSYYLYSPKLKKFAGLIGQEVNFTAPRHVPFTITTDGTGGVDGSVFRLKYSQPGFFVNNNNSGSIVLNSYSAAEGGNTMTFYEVPGVTIDEEEALSALHPESMLDEHKVYKITNSRINTWTANATATALTGTSTYSAATEAEQEFAFIKRDGKFYMYNVGTKKFVGMDGDNTILTGDKTQFTSVEYLQTTSANYPYKFYLPEKKFFFNAQGTGGFVINGWSNEDDGNRNQIVEVAGVDVYDEMLDFFEAPYWDVTYTVYCDGKKVDEVVVNSKRNATADLPASNKKDFTSYSFSPATIATGVTEVEVTATWNSPLFETSTDLANAHWYNMSVRGNWYVTSGNKDGDGALKTVEANAVGLVEDAYQWAFVGNAYEGIKIFNKAVGDSKAYAWVSNDNASIPTFVDAASANAWNIKASTASGFTNAFMLTTDKGYQTNQFGGAGGSLKIWQSTGTGDAGSAFNVFDVPTNFASFLVAEGIDAKIEATGYFAFTDEAKATFNWDPAYKTDCPFEAYKNLKEKLAAVDMSNMANFNLPETGYYILKNKNYEDGYLGISPSDGELWGNYKTATAAKNIVKLTKNEDNTYTIGLMGKFAPATVTQSTQVIATADAANYTVIITTPGFAAFQLNPEVKMSALHRAGDGSIVGWEAASAASQWEVLDPGTIEYTIGESGYATAYFPFAVTLPEPTEITVPKAKGIFKFDDAGNITAGLGTSTLSVYGEGVTAAAGPDAENGAVSVPVGGGFLLDTKLDAVSSAYTFMFDVSFPDVSSYNCLFQNDVNFKDTPKKDGSFFIKDGKVGFNSAGLGYKGTINANTWYRIIVVMNDSRCTVYVDGTKVGGPTTAQDVNAWAMRDTKQFLLFVDNDGEEKQVNASEVCFWDVALTDAEAAMLGTVGSDPVVETKAVTAYTGKINKTWFTTTEIKDGIIPEATPVILKGDPYTYKFKVGVSEPNDEEEIPENALKVYDKTVDGGKALAKRQIIPEPIEENDLKGTFEPINAIDKYVLAKPEGKDVCFYRAESGTIAAGKAYLELDGNTGPLVKIFFGDVDDETAIDNVNANGNANQGAIYNIAGQKLSKFQKGINIVNGKKVLF